MRWTGRGHVMIGGRTATNRVNMGCRDVNEWRTGKETKITTATMEEEWETQQDNTNEDVK